jgi:NAD(P)-dependent dehydrogenase (short-subunit alcohol dehydrogenase family)
VVRKIAVTGSASGLGAAVCAQLAGGGDRVIGVDQRDAEVVADLCQPAGRAAAVEAVAEIAQHALDGLVVAAGLGPHVADRGAIASVNYFGAVAVLDGLRDVLARGIQPAAVAVASNSATIGAADELVDVMLQGDEDATRAAAQASNGVTVYSSSKRALALAARHRAPAWGDDGVRLNAVAPGPFGSPMMDGILADAVIGPMVESFPIPLGRRGDVGEVASVITFLLSPAASWVHGHVLFVDGGSDALLRPDAL